jgi:hypothetical protein
MVSKNVNVTGYTSSAGRSNRNVDMISNSVAGGHWGIPSPAERARLLAIGLEFHDDSADAIGTVASRTECR